MKYALALVALLLPLACAKHPTTPVTVKLTVYETQYAGVGMWRVHQLPETLTAEMTPGHVVHTARMKVDNGWTRHNAGTHHLELMTQNRVLQSPLLSARFPETDYSLTFPISAGPVVARIPVNDDGVSLVVHIDPN